ncbi:unnamed protein product, partial [marine sediment metagenome]
MHRLYGSRNSYVDMIYEAVAKDSDGEEQAILLEHERDAELWRVLKKVMQHVDLNDLEVNEMNVKAARNKHLPTFSLAKTIDLARKNSLRLRFNLFNAIEDISRGDMLRAHFESLDNNDMNAVNEWTKIVWE